MIVRSLIAAFLLLVTIVVVLGVGILSSAAGSRLILGWVEEQLGPRLDVTGLDGSLLSDLCAEEVRYRQPGLSVVVSRVCVGANLWSSIDFFKLSLQTLEAASVVIETSPAPSEPASAPFSMPLAIEVEAFHLDALVVNDVRLDGLDGALDISNADVASTSSFSFKEHRVALRTDGPFRALKAELSALGVDVTATADVLDETLPYRLTARAPALDLEPFVGRAVRLSDVSLAGSGNLTTYRFDLAGQVEDPSASGRVRTSGRGDWSGLTLSAVTLTGVSVSELPLALEEVTGRVTLEWSEAFQLLAEGVQGRGTLREIDFRADVPSLAVSARGVDFREAALRILGAREAGVVRAEGSVAGDQTLALTLAGERFPLSALLPELGGFGTFRMDVSGVASRPVLSGEVTLDELRYGEQSLSRLSGRIDGQPEAARLTLSAWHAEGSMESRLEYRIEEDGRVMVSIDSLEGRFARVPAGARLLSATRVAFHDGAVTIPETCLELFTTDTVAGTELDPARLCVSVEYPGGGLSIDLEPWMLPELALPAGGVVLKGQARATARLASFQPLTGAANVRLFDLLADHDGGDALALGVVETDVTLRDGVIRAELNTPSETAQELELDGDLTLQLASPVGESTLGGELNLELDGIWAARSLLPMEVSYELERMRGVMGVQASVGGTVAVPLINGVLTLRDAGARVLALNTELSGFNANARLTDSETISFDSRGAIGSGTLAIDGEILALNTTAPRLATRFELERAEVIELPDYRASVSGEVALEMGSDDLKITGALVLDHADIEIAEVPETAVSPSADEVLVGEEDTPPAQQIRTTDVTMTLGKDVRLEAFGLKARLVGSLRLEEAPRRLQSVTGTISLREGEFEAYGQLLRVERGRLTFTGPVDNPTVDVQATKTVTYEERDYKISLVISGTARDLVTTIRSQPVLAEDDALALLLTGKTISQVSTQERSNVNGAALSMGLLNAMGVTQNLATRLNLEEIIVDQDDEGNMEVGAAVRLNRDIYLRYTYGVFSRLGGVLLRYRLSNRLSVQAKTGDAHSIEIRYGVD